MKRLSAIGLAVGLAMMTASPARAFSLLGIWDTWQTGPIGYQLAGDIGGPMGLGEGYRWNVPVITYAFDRSFLLYFGQRGVDEVEKAIAILNALPPVSNLSSNLAEFPLDSKRVNYQAQALYMYDLKSAALETLVEILGLAEPERYAFCLRARQLQTVGNTTVTNYLVIQRNFDPVTWVPTRLVNGTAYSYQVLEPLTPGNYADAIEFVTDPLALSYTAVASKSATLGQYYTGLTRDDVGGLRYLYRYHNFAVENLAAGVTNSFGAGTGGGYMIWWPTNATLQTNFWGGTGTNTIQTTGLRPGIEKITFRRVDYDSLLGQQLVPYTHYYTDLVITNYVAYPQYVARTVTTPDILFTAADLGVSAGVPAPVLIDRTVTFTSNDALNGSTVQAGPGTLSGPAAISFTTLLPAFLNDDTFFDEASASRTGVWGAFDGTTNAPVVFPSILSIQYIEQQVQSR
ncbi:MAG: hypothetical protein N3J91_07355 [Verrucomicrobiae bacterium]|nr:hypothetical protein [Verrucomicrobiae bacterium]